MQESVITALRKSVTSLNILAVLASLYTLYIAQDLVLLLLVTGLVSLLLSPGVRLLLRFRIPRPLGAFILLVSLVVPASLFFAQLQEPVTKWAKLVPELSSQVSQQINLLDEAIQTSTTAVQPESEQKSSWLKWFSAKEPEPEPLTEQSSEVFKTHLKESLFSFVSAAAVSAPLMIFQFFTSIILILFTLIYSPRLFHHYVQLFVPEGERNRVNCFALEAQKELSRYILTVSLINMCLAILIVSFLYIMGFQDAFLLGVIFGLLNFMPFIGPLVGLTIIAIGGFVQWGADINLLFVVSGVMLIIAIESQFITPLVLAKHMRINPFIIILWLLLTGWMWGLIGVIIAVPILVCIKLILAQFQSTKSWVTFLST